MANRYPVVFSPQPSAGQLPLDELDVGDQLIDPTTGQPYLSAPGSGRLLWGAAPPSDPLRTYALGDACFNEDPATNKSIGGWICTTGGIGGVAVWTPFYLVYGAPQNGYAITWDSSVQKARWAAAPGPSPSSDEEEDDSGGEHMLIWEANAFAESIVAVEAATINARIGRVTNELADSIDGLSSSLNSDLQAGVGDAKAFAESVVAVEAATINARVAKNVNELGDSIDALASSVGTDLQEGVGRAKSYAENVVAVEAGLINARVSKVANELEDSIASAISEANNDLQSGVGEAKAFAEGVVAVESGLINARITKNVDELADAIAGETSESNNNLQAGIAEAEAFAEGAVAVEAARINDRIGKKYSLTTTGVGPTVLATLTPSPTQATKIIAEIVAHRVDRLEAAIYKVLALARAVPASNILTLSVAVPTAGETVTIGTTVYTWQNVLAAAYDVKIGADNEVSVDNLVKAINLTGIAGTDYGVGTAKHPSVSAVKASVALPVATMEAVALLPGAAGNLIAVADTMLNGAWGGAGFLAGGLDMALFGATVTTEYEDDAAWAVGIAAVGAGVDISVTGVANTAIKWLAEVKALEIF